MASPLKALKACNGIRKTFAEWVVLSLEIFVVAASSKVTFRLSAPLPLLLIKITLVPSGENNAIAKSPLNVCSTSIAIVRLDTKPVLVTSNVFVKHCSSTKFSDVVFVIDSVL